MKYSENLPWYLIFFEAVGVWFSSPSLWSSLENTESSLVSEHKSRQG